MRLSFSSSCSIVCNGIPFRTSHNPSGNAIFQQTRTVCEQIYKTHTSSGTAGGKHTSRLVQNTIFFPWLGTIETASRWACASAAPGFARRAGCPLLRASRPTPLRSRAPSSPSLRRRFVGGARSSASSSPASTSSPSTPPALFATRSRFPGRTLPPSLNLDLCGSPSVSLSRGGPPPPLRTASGEAYSTTSLRPLRWWFRGFVSAAVACSMEVKSTKAHLLPAGCGQLPLSECGNDHEGDEALTLCTCRCPRTSPTGLSVSTCRPPPHPSPCAPRVAREWTPLTSRSRGFRGTASVLEVVSAR